MPTYEMPMLLRVMTKPETATVLKRAAQCIFSKGGFIRKIENLGEKPIPYKISAHSRVHKEAQYFVLSFDVPPSSLQSIQDEYNRDIDVIRNRIFKQEEESSYPCTLEQELQPPAYRSEVQTMMRIAKKREKSKRKFEYGSGLTNYPFQK